MTTFTNLAIAPQLIDAQKVAAAPWFPLDGLHREQVIVDIANLEAAALGAIRRFARSIRRPDKFDEIDTALRAADLSDETSLGKLSGILFLLNLIDTNIHHDLRTLYKIRTIYAHKAAAGQMGADPAPTRLMYDLSCYKSNCAALAELDGVGKIYRAIVAHLHEGLSQLSP